jgi:ABC-2 type transport system permease protein
LALVLTPTLIGLARSAATPPAWVAGPSSGIPAALESVALGALPVAFAAALLGMIAMGSEYTGDVISGTFVVAPKRQLVLLMKCVPACLAAISSSLVGLGAAAGLSVAVLGSRGYDALPAPVVAGIVLSGGAASGILCVIGVAATALTRSLVAAAVQLAILLALGPSVIGMAAGANAQVITDLLPSSAIQTMVTRAPAAAFPIEGSPPSSLPWWGGVIVLSAWGVLYIVAAIVSIGMRPALRAQRSCRPRKRRCPSATRAHRGLSRLNVLRSELLKLFTLPATWWFLGIGMLATVVLGFNQASRSNAGDELVGVVLADDLHYATFSAQQQTIGSSMGLVPILVAMLGAIFVTSEFTVGTIRPTIVATPARTVWLLTKLGVVAITVAVAIGVSQVVTAAATTPVLVGNGFEATLTAPIVGITILRGTLVCTFAAVVGAAIGVILRAPIAAISAIVLVLVLAPGSLGQLQGATRGTWWVWLANLSDLFPAAQLAIRTPDDRTVIPQFLDGGVLQLLPDQAMLVALAWAAVLTLIAIITFRRRAI